MKHVIPHGHAHDHPEHANRHLDVSIENIFTLLMVLASLSIPFALIMYFFPK